MNKRKIKLTTFILLFLFSNAVVAEAYFDISENNIKIETNFIGKEVIIFGILNDCLLYTSPSPRDVEESRMPSSA